MIKNYIFDFGNVLAKFHPLSLTRAVVKDEETAKLISEVAFDRLYWDRLDDGTASDNEVIEKIKERLPKELWEKGVKAYSDWIENLTPVEGMADFVKSLKEKGARIYLLSNISIGFAENYHKVAWIKELFSLFDGLVFSGPIGITKPQPEIFQYILDKYGLNREETLFVDDSEINIDGAKSVGLKAHLFLGNSKEIEAII